MMTSRATLTLATASSILTMLAPPAYANPPAGMHAPKTGVTKITGLPPKPETFRTPDGKLGWKLHVPGGRPLATPAYAEDMVYVGGGYGSHEFYALRAGTGEVVWQDRKSVV